MNVDYILQGFRTNVFAYELALKCYWMKEKEEIIFIQVSVHVWAPWHLSGVFEVIGLANGLPAFNILPRDNTLQ